MTQLNLETGLKGVPEFSFQGHPQTHAQTPMGFYPSEILSTYEVVSNQFSLLKLLKIYRRHVY